MPAVMPAHVGFPGLYYRIMDELVLGRFYCMLANLVSRSWVVLLARRESNRTPGEEGLASLPVMPTRDLTVAADGFHGCISVMKERRASRLTSVAALLHVLSLVLFVLLLLLIGFIPLIRYLLSAH